MTPQRWYTRALDGLYDRADLWKDRHARLADHGKVRGFWLYVAVTLITAYVVVTAKELPAAFLTAILLGMLAGAFGERVLVSFFKAWGSRGVADVGGGGRIQLPRSPGRDPAEGVDPTDG